MQTAEVERVEAWQAEQFRRLGFDMIQASALMRAGIDYHRAEALVQAGCPFELVVEILT